MFMDRKTCQCFPIWFKDSMKFDQHLSAASLAPVSQLNSIHGWASGLRLCVCTSGGVVLTLGQGTKIPHALWQSQKQQQNIVERKDRSVE